MSRTSRIAIRYTSYAPSHCPDSIRMLAIPYQSYSSYDIRIFTAYHPELWYARSELWSIDDQNRETYHPFLFFWAICMSFFIVFRICGDEWLICMKISTSEWPFFGLFRVSNSFVRMVLDGTWSSLVMDSYITYRHSTDTAGIHIVRLLRSKWFFFSLTLNVACVSPRILYVHSGNCVRLIRQHDYRNFLCKVWPMQHGYAMMREYFRKVLSNSMRFSHLNCSKNCAMSCHSYRRKMHFVSIQHCCHAFFNLQIFHTYMSNPVHIWHWMIRHSLWPSLILLVSSY